MNDNKPSKEFKAACASGACRKGNIAAVRDSLDAIDNLQRDRLGDASLGGFVIGAAIMFVCWSAFLIGWYIATPKKTATFTPAEIKQIDNIAKRFKEAKIIIEEKIICKDEAGKFVTVSKEEFDKSYRGRYGNKK